MVRPIFDLKSDNGVFLPCLYCCLGCVEESRFLQKNYIRGELAWKSDRDVSKNH